MKNIGKVSRAWLFEIGIQDISQLRRFGSVQVYKMIRMNHPNKASLNLLWALEGAIQDIHWTEIPEELKEELKAKVFKM